MSTRCGTWAPLTAPGTYVFLLARPLITRYKMGTILVPLLATGFRYDWDIHAAMLTRPGRPTSEEVWWGFICLQSLTQLSWICVSIKLLQYAASKES